MAFILQLISILCFATFCYGLFRLFRPSQKHGRGIATVMAVGGFMFMGIFITIYGATPAGKAEAAAKIAAEQKVVTDRKAKGEAEAKKRAEEKGAQETKAAEEKAKADVKAAEETAKLPKIHFTGEFIPRILSVGEKLVIKLGIENKGTEEISGVSIFGSGSHWKKFTIANVMPNGDWDVGSLGTRFNTGLNVPPGQKLYVNLIVYPNEPGNYDLSFIPRDGQGRQLLSESGETWVIGGKIGVTR